MMKLRWLAFEKIESVLPCIEFVVLKGSEEMEVEN